MFKILIPIMMLAFSGQLVAKDYLDGTSCQCLDQRGKRF